MLSRILPTGRWKLLRALWKEDATGSVRALARQNQLSYSSAHAELKRLERAGLVRSRAVGNSLIFEANRSHPVASAVDALVRASADPPPPQGEQYEPLRVMANLKALGAAVRDESTPTADMPPEEAVAQGLRLAHRDPALARSFPVLLARNRNRLNMEFLRQRASVLKEKQTLGFFLDLTGVLADDPALRSFAQSLKDRRVKKTRDFFETAQGRRARDLAERRTPPVAKDWNFRMDMDMDNFRQLYSKFCEA